MEYERIREQRRRFELEMQKLDQQQRREALELAQMEEEVGRMGGHQSEPTTPPQVYSTALLDPARNSLLPNPVSDRHALDLRILRPRCLLVLCQLREEIVMMRRRRLFDKIPAVIALVMRK
jgi:hypothetical protein